MAQEEKTDASVLKVNKLTINDAVRWLCRCPSKQLRLSYQKQTKQWMSLAMKGFKNILIQFANTQSNHVAFGKAIIEAFSKKEFDRIIVIECRNESKEDL